MPEPKLLDQVREYIRLKHLSRRTERAYVSWIRRFARFHELHHETRGITREVHPSLRGHRRAGVHPVHPKRRPPGADRPREVGALRQRPGVARPQGGAALPGIDPPAAGAQGGGEPRRGGRADRSAAGGAGAARCAG
ncbi:MAG: phage integrase N-terminal SAM-like domain-containing protein [Gemmatimonadetes bacterium]|nr:phage integrase N-terminal SAM-like domain-containing protein [Gemmatimonadota bacterium]